MIILLQKLLNFNDHMLMSPKMTYVRSRVSKIELKDIPITDIPLPIRHHQLKEGFPAIHFTPLELQRTEALFQFTLIAKFLRGRPTMETIRIHINEKWGLQQVAIVGLIDARHILIKLANAEDFALAWTRDNHQMEGALYRLFKWSADFNLGKEPPVAPVWIRFPLLPKKFCVKSYLKNISASVGKCLAIDLPTLTYTRPQFARVCVEIDLTKPRIRKV